MVDFLAASPLAVATRAIQDRLKLIFPEKRFVHRMVPARMDGASWKRLIGDGRFVGLGWAEIAPDSDEGRSFNGDAQWVVFLACRNPSGVMGAMFGDARGPGLFAFVHAAIAVLQAFSIPGAGTLMVTAATNAYADGWDEQDGLAMAAVHCGLRLNLAPPEGIDMTAPEDLKQIAATWQFADDSTVGPDIFDVRNS